MRVVQPLSGLILPADIRWKAAPGLVWRRWPDTEEWVVFHAGSGDVHLVSEAAAGLLRLLELESATAEMLQGLLTEPDDSLEYRDSHTTLAAILAAFDRAGLIEPAR